MTFAKPKIVHDQGSEFRGETAKLLRKYGISDSASMPYHPQSQGKIERTHRMLKRTIMYDILRAKGGNWIRNLLKYNAKINNSSKKELAWHTPFEVFYNRKHWKGNTKTTSLNSTLLLGKVRQATKMVNTAAVKRSAKSLKAAQYEKGDCVLLRIKTGGKLSKCRAVDGLVEDTDHNRYMYQFKCERNKKTCMKWVSLRDVTASTLKLQWSKVSEKVSRNH